MAIKDLFIKNKVGGSLQTPKFAFDIYVKDSDLIKEQLKGEIQQTEIKFPKDLGEEHPFDFEVLEGLYQKFGFVTAVIDKYIDFMISGGFFIKTENENAKQILEDWMRDVNFDTLLRTWVKEGLLKGTGFLELGGNEDEAPKGAKVLDSNFMFIKRDKKGVITGFNQFTGMFEKFKKAESIPFEPFQIAELPLNKLAGDAYGMGIVYPAINTINNLLKNEKDMHQIIGRKANEPYWIKMGTIENPPTAEDIQNFGSKLDALNNKQEFVTGPEFDIKAVTLGNVGEKFQAVLEYDIDMLFFTFQIPEVLMGRSVNLATAPVQMDAFERRIQSLQAEVEKIIEDKIFKRILRANNIDEHVEFEWGQPSRRETNEKVDRLTNLLKLFGLSNPLKKELEKDIAQSLGYDEEVLMSIDEERELDETRPQPIVPGSNRRGAGAQRPREEEEHFQEGFEYEKDIELKEWLGFDFNKYLESILKEVRDDKFEFLSAKSSEQLLAGKLDGQQVSKLKKVLAEGFKKGLSIRAIEKSILREVKIKDLLKTQDGQLEFDSKGKPIVQIQANRRANMVARSETTRLAANGSLGNYKEGGVKEVAWVAAFGDRTCPICEGLNGQIYPVDGAVGLIPAHTACRCTWRAVV